MALGSALPGSASFQSDPVVCAMRCAADASAPAHWASGSPCAAACSVVCRILSSSRCRPRPPSHDHLAAQQIERMNAVGALVNGVEPIVSVELLDVVVAGIPVSAVDLDGQAVGLHAPLRRPALGDRSQHLQQQRGLVSIGIGWGRECLVDEAAAIQPERQCALDVTLLGQQHSAHVGMGDDRDLCGGCRGPR